jgi:hypothetical protein
LWFHSLRIGCLVQFNTETLPAAEFINQYYDQVREGSREFVSNGPQTLQRIPRCLPQASESIHRFFTIHFIRMCNLNDPQRHAVVHQLLAAGVDCGIATAALPHQQLMFVRRCRTVELVAGW